ncbi:unnamed protein product [Sphagnum jensenii]
MNKVTQAWYDAHPEVVRKKYEKKGHVPRVKGRQRREHRKYLEDKCRRCGFVPEDVCQLTVDHIDRNHKNNVPENLQTLCANCHNLKTKRVMTVRVDITDLSDSQIEELECAMVAQFEDLNVKNTIEDDVENDDYFD